MLAHVAAAILVTSAPMAAIELTSRAQRIGPHLARAAVHVGSSAAILAASSFASLHELAITGLTITAGMIALRPRRFWRSLYQVERQSLGEIFFPLGAAAAALVAPSPAVFRLAIALLGIADTCACLVGRRVGGRAILAHGKTYAGTAACWGSATAMCVATGVRPLAASLAVGVAVALAEAIAPKGSDNLSIPLAAIGAIAVFDLHV